MKKFYGLMIALAFVFTACTSHQKKILVYANSDIVLDESQKNISVQDGNTQIEKELTFSGSDPVVLNIKSPQGNYSLEAKDDGYFIANLKKDTIVGSLQHTGSISHSRITQDELKIQLDSLNKLVKGANISPEAKNYFIPSGKIDKISNQTSVKVFGPFTSIPTDFDVSSVQEIYKFYNLSEVEKIISRLTDMGTYKEGK
jgi:hypothetical protein